jgi:uncharacterized OB-fold protein
LHFPQAKTPHFSFVARGLVHENLQHCSCSKSRIPSQGDDVSEPSYPLWRTDPKPALLASRDLDTSELVFPALSADSPLAPRYETVPLAAVGEVYSFTVIHPSPKSGEAPYALGYVDLPGPVRIFGRLTGQARPVIGERYAARPDERFGYVFEAVQG